MCGANPYPHLPQNCNLRKFVYFLSKVLAEVSMDETLIRRLIIPGK
nr:MAG TPA: hypothetical protein [Caudoviricetes sp.]